MTTITLYRIEHPVCDDHGPFNAHRTTQFRSARGCMLDNRETWLNERLYKIMAHLRDQLFLECCNDNERYPSIRDDAIGGFEDGMLSACGSLDGLRHWFDSYKLGLMFDLGFTLVEYTVDIADVRPSHSGYQYAFHNPIKKVDIGILTLFD